MDNLFQISKKDEILPSFTYYTILGKQDYIDTDGFPIINNKEHSLAYTKNINNEIQYFLKVGLYGKIYNPMGLYSEGKSNKFMAKIGKNEYNFTRVNRKVFDMYLNFLKSKNIAWLNNAERELS
jgi:hypothetical protein